MKAVMYHYVREYDPEFPHFKNLHVDDFKQQLDYFESCFGFVSKDEFRMALQTGMNPEGVILTFDDGLKDHLAHVLPVLKERGLWGIFYIPTMMYETKKFLDVHKTHLLLGKFTGREVYDCLLACIKDTYLTYQHIREFKELTYSDQVNDDYSLLVKRTLNYFIDIKWKSHVLDSVIDHFFQNVNQLWQSFYLSPGEIYDLHKSDMIVGSHTVTHPVMSQLPIERQKKEIQRSFRFLKTIVGEFNIKTFCYPYGGFHSFTAGTEYVLNQEGCAFSFNVETRDIEVRDLLWRPQALPRYDCNHFPYGQCRNVLNKESFPPCRVP
jgi:peptidoglycan/xylan/chitin deacetylase (PgdA/CDA1 family)